MCDSVYSCRDKRLSILVNCLGACFDAIEFLEFQNAHLVQLCNEFGPSYEFSDPTIDCVDVKYNPVRFSSLLPAQTYCVAHSEITITETHVDVTNNVRAVIRFSESLSVIEKLMNSVIQAFVKAKTKIVEYYSALR